MGKLTIAGLGPGDKGQITLAAWDSIRNAGKLILRTRNHPAVAYLEEQGICYDALDRFDVSEKMPAQVNQDIVSYLVEQCCTADVVYAVPGNPIVEGETAALLAEQAPKSGIMLQILPGISTWEAPVVENEEPLPFDMTPLSTVMATLRSDHGCPWDKAQTHRTLRRYLLEEVYEMLDAIDNQDYEGIREELGDILYQISFHCQLAQECGIFKAQDVIDDIADKMKRRHPHVFKQLGLENVGNYMVNWDKLKQEEKRQQHEYVLDGVVKGLPSLLQAYKLQEKAAKTGFDWDDTKQAWGKVAEEWQEFQETLQENDPEHAEEEAGDVLFGLVNLFRRYDIEPECALHRANSKFRRRFSHVEDCVKASRKSWQDFTLPELDSFWQEAKKMERKK